MKLSNSLLLETLGWSGIVGEALDSYYQKAKASRTCTVVHGALASESGNEIEFYERGLLSSSVIYSASDMHAKAREQGSKVKCFTKRIDEILYENAAPKEIGYFSLDVEGAELEVLKTFPFDSYQVKCSTIEHNHTDQEGKIDKFMFDNGFKRVLREISGNDGFYIHQKASIFEWGNSGFEKIRKHKTVDDFVDFFKKKLQGW